MLRIPSRTFTVCGLVAALMGANGGLASRARAVSAGTPTDGSYSFVVKLKVGEARTCSGVLISPWQVVTTASCLSTGASAIAAGPPPEATTAIIGRSSLTGTDGYAVRVVRLTPHPTRNVALAELEVPIEQVETIAIASTPASAGEVLRVAGYGRTSSVWIPDRPESAAFSVQGTFENTLELVGASAPNASTCKGDAGGPAFRERDGKRELVAINHTSWQSGCLGESETRQGITEVRMDDLASWVNQQPASGRRHGAIQWATNGRCVNALRNQANGDPLQLWDCAARPDAPKVASVSQHWLWTNLVPAFQHRTSDTAREVYLDFPYGQPGGTQLVIWEPSGMASQHWSLIEQSLMNGGLCLDIVAGDIAPDAKLWFWSCNRTNAQLWTLPGDGTIRPTANLSLCVDNSYGRRADGNPVLLWPCSGGPAQQWQVTEHGLVNPQGCLDRDIAAGGGERSRAQLWSCNRQPNQYFWLAGSLQNAQGFSMDVRAGNPDNGAAIQGWVHLWNPNQSFNYWP